MSKVSAAVASALVPQEQAEWHPYQVWASQVRPGETASEPSKPAGSDAKRESWDPFSVWKRQVKR